MKSKQHPPDKASKSRSFRNGVSLHRLIETAPLGALESFLRTVDDGKFASAFCASPWPSAVDDESATRVRTAVMQAANELPQDLAVPLDRHAQRVLTLSEGRGPEALGRVTARMPSDPRMADYKVQLDAIGRSLWLYTNKKLLFDEAESLFYIDHYRNYGRMYEAFELARHDGANFQWDDTVKEHLEVRIQEMLELTGRCSVTHLETTSPDRAGGSQIQHLILVRHGGPLSSVAEFLETDGSRRETYYRPLNEATLLYSPDEGVMEVYSGSPAVRQRIAMCFAQVALKMDLSDRPLTLKQYDLSRFLSSLTLDVPEVAGVDIERVAVVEVECRPHNPKHRVGLTVTVHDDIEVAARALFGEDHIFRRAASVARIVIAARYTPDGETQVRTLNITLSDPNRCNLRSNRDAAQRELGYTLLSGWGILHRIATLDNAQERVLFPALLQLFDQTRLEVPGAFFAARNLDLNALQRAGFIERKGRDTSLLIEDDGVRHEVPIVPSGQAGMLAYHHPVDGHQVLVPVTAAEKFRVRREWLDEVVIKKLVGHLSDTAYTRLDDMLSYLGEIDLGNAIVPAFLARDLRTTSTLQRLDLMLRTRSDKRIGVIFSAAPEIPLCLGPHVVVPILDFLAEPDGDDLIDVAKLSSLFAQRKQLAQGGMAVHLVRNKGHSASLYVPGKPPLTLTGLKQIGFFQALVDAHLAGSPAVASKILMDAAGSASASPSQLFGTDLWASIFGQYVGRPEGSLRGLYLLLV